MAVRGDWTPNEVLKADDLNDTFALKVASADVNTIKVLTQADYDLLAPATDTLYVIVG